MKLNEIPVAVVRPDAAPNTVNAPALLHEVASLLARLVETGEAASIDLRSLPLAPADYALLEETLGRGEVAVEIQAAGLTRVRETGVNGVWWVKHYNAVGETVGELIEVTCVPEILKTHRSDAARGLERLWAQLQATTRSAEGRDDAG
jgi:hydrogenase-1 operon protein HyaF